jgi:dihydrofolate reductase
MIRSIFSIDQRGGLGNKGSLPWPSDSEDMAWFKNATTNGVVIMGRRTWNDPMMPKPLPDRINVVLSSMPVVSASKNVFTRSGDIRSVLTDVQSRWPGKDIWIIGGADLLMESKDYCDEMWIAHRKGAYFTDVRVDLNKYMTGTRILSSAPNQARTINWCTYRNIDLFRPYL